MLVYYVYELGTWSQDLNLDFTVKDFFFGAINSTKNADPGEYPYF